MIISHQNKVISFHPYCFFLFTFTHREIYINLQFFMSMLCMCPTTFHFENVPKRRSKNSQWKPSTIHLPLPTSVCICQEHGHLLKNNHNQMLTLGRVILISFYYLIFSLALSYLIIPNCFVAVFPYPDLCQQSLKSLIFLATFILQ